MPSIKSFVAACCISTSFLAVSANAAGLTVNSSADDGTGTCTASKCTLRDAVLTAVSGTVITFSLPAASTIALTNGQLVIDKDLTINGPGAKLLMVQRSTASGTPSFGIFSIVGVSTVPISGLTIARGQSSNMGGGISIGVNATVFLESSIIAGNSATAGGGISNSGVLLLTNSTLADNQATLGGGISNDADSATLVINNSTFSQNRATVGGGIGIQAGAVAIVNSTFFGNTATEGGGIYGNGGTLTASNSTIAGNSASQGGGISSQNGKATIRNTIVAENLNLNGAGPDIYDLLSPVISQGFNLIGNNSGAHVAPKTGDQIGTPASPIDPKLGPLQDNGGPSQTRALLPGSTAIDKGNSPDSPYDQRGLPRRIDSPIIANAADGSDIGAYEVQPSQLVGCSEINLIVNNNSDGSAGSLRAVIANACGGSTVTFAANVRGAIDLTSGEISINRNLTVNGPGANVLSVQRSAAPGTANFRIFNLALNATAALSGLTIANGNTPGQLGGGIINSGTLTLTAVAVSGNSALNGGGIYNDAGTLTLNASTISGNTVSSSIVAGSGGGIFNHGGMVSIATSTISGNSAQGPGAGDSGGGIMTNVGRVRILDSTISGNTADSGGGIRNVNGGIVQPSNTIIALNTSPNGPDVNGNVASLGYNLVGNGAGAIITPAQSSDQIGVTPAQLNLGPLQDNGGPTRTHALLPGSYAIDKGAVSGFDQRGFERPVDLPNIPNVFGSFGGDIGAFEVQAPATVLEFYNVSLDHYFITWIAGEIANLDAGTVIKGWTRTGKTFKTYTTPTGTSPVCRYYIPPGLGDSHFFGRGTVECNATGQKNPTFVLEDPAFMQMYLPVGGNCPANTTQIYRVFSNRPDANHRYMTDKATRDQMVSKGWLVEGDGPDAVVMCAPQ
jgi:CSLREA domain-containing protein